MNESAVEWFAKQVLEYKSPTNLNGTDYILIPVDKIDFLKEQAKEMEKQQIKTAFHKNSQKFFCEKEAEQYYNETFKSE